MITLVTGDRIAVATTNGKASYSPLGGNSALHEFQGANGDEYLFPAIAEPYLGHGLDESLFDVTALVRNGDTGAIPVTLSFTGTPAAPAGVTLTSVTGETAAGYLTPGSATDFGAALRQRIGADVAAGHPAGTTAAFPGLAGISLAGVAEPSPVTPDYPLHPVQINVTDLAGKPASGVVYLADVDAFSHLLAGMPITTGVGKVEAPAGNYMLVAYFADFDASGNVTAERQVIKEGLSVPSGTGTTEFSVSEAEANLPVTVSTPRPASAGGTVDLYARTDATGQQELFGTFGSVPLYVNASTPTVGSGYMSLSWFGLAPDSSYFYSVAFTDKTGIPVDENFVVNPDQVATVADRLYASAATTGTGSMTAIAVDPALTFGLGLGVPVAWGKVLTQYVGTATSDSWLLSAISPAEVFFNGPLQSFTGGRQYALDWGKGPLTPTLISQPGDAYCEACVGGSTLNLDDGVLGDSDPAQTGFAFGAPKSLSFTLYQGDKQVVTGSSPYATVTGVPSAHTTFREVMDQDWTGINGFDLSTTTHTERTFGYDPADPSIATQYACAGWTASTPCQVLPVLAAHYDLAGLDLAGASTDRVQRLDLGIDHVTYSGAGSTSAVTAATVSVSFDGGAHWLRVPVLGRAGRYTAFWPNTARGVSPAIKVTARDADGNTLSQTVTNAYLIGGVLNCSAFREHV